MKGSNASKLAIRMLNALDAALAGLSASEQLDLCHEIEFALIEKRHQLTRDAINELRVTVGLPPIGRYEP